MPASPADNSRPVAADSLLGGGDALPALSDDGLQLWRFPLPLPGGALRQRVESLPDAAEHARAGRLVFAADRLRQLHSRGLLRLLLGASLGRPPRSLRFVENAFGKPAVADADGLHFNLSHCRDQALIGMSRVAPLGVDIERLRPLPDRDALVALCFSPAEQAWLADQPPAGQERDFLRLWTAKEAVLKALGSGLATPPESISISLPAPHRPAGQVAGAPGPWTLFSASPGPQHILAAGIRSQLPAGRIEHFHLAGEDAAGKNAGPQALHQVTLHGQA